MANILPELNIRVGVGIGVSLELLVVGTGQEKDNTRQICDKFGAKYIFREGGLRYGDAIRTAQRYVAGKDIIVMDADGSHDPSDVARLFKLRNRPEPLIIGSRYAPGGVNCNPHSLVLMSKVLNWIYRLVLGIRVYDVSNSLRLYRKEDFCAVKLECNDIDIVE